MSVVAGYTLPGSTDTTYITTVKGAPETIRDMVGGPYYVHVLNDCVFMIS